jgi:mono/diheme cytochrome c family protein
MGLVSLVCLALSVASAGAAEPAAPSFEGGRALFTGEKSTHNGGPPCGACHAVAGEGLAFAGSLGPELSTAVKELDADGLAGLLELLPFPTMAPLYDAHPLTPEERADLAAFLLPVAQRGVPAFGWQLPLSAASIVVPLALGLALAWRRRKGPTRARLVARATAAPGGQR